MTKIEQSQSESEQHYFGVENRKRVGALRRKSVKFVTQILLFLINEMLIRLAGFKPTRTPTGDIFYVVRWQDGSDTGFYETTRTGAIREATKWAEGKRSIIP